MSEDKLYKDALQKKNWSIAWFNANNNAIALVISMGLGLTGDVLKAEIELWRNWFLEKHADYYNTVIASIGQNFNVAETIKKLEAAESSDHLYKIWLELSQDERDTAEVIAVKNKMKEKYAKPNGN